MEKDALSNRGLILFALWWAKKFTRNDGFIPYFDENTFAPFPGREESHNSNGSRDSFFFRGKQPFRERDGQKYNDGKQGEARIE